MKAASWIQLRAIPKFLPSSARAEITWKCSKTEGKRKNNLRPASELSLRGSNGYSIQHPTSAMPLTISRKLLRWSSTWHKWHTFPVQVLLIWRYLKISEDLWSTVSICFNLFHHLFGEKKKIWLRLQCDFQCNMRRRHFAWDVIRARSLSAGCKNFGVWWSDPIWSRVLRCSRNDKKLVASSCGTVHEFQEVVVLSGARSSGYNLSVPVAIQSWKARNLRLIKKLVKPAEANMYCKNDYISK